MSDAKTDSEGRRFGHRGLCLRRFGRDVEGASALEFALVAVPFLLLLFAVIEVGLVNFANFTLENATTQAARLIRTGQAQGQKLNAAQFKAELCKHLNGPLDCGGIKLDVRRFSKFGDATLPSPLDGNGNLKTNFTYAPGEGGDVVVVRSFYEWSLAAKLPKDVGLSNMQNGNRLLAATVAFRNEPFKQ